MVGVLFYSYTYHWFGPARPGGRRVRMVANGLVFGLLAVVLMIARIEVADGVYVDARNVPVALVALFEGWPAGLVAAVMAAAYRQWLGGAGATAGTAAVIVAAVAGGLVHAWVRTRGGVRTSHALGLAAIVYVTTFLSYVIVGPYGVGVVRQAWLPLLLFYAVGIALTARLMADVVEREAVVAAQREAAELRAVTLLAGAAAHEINNPLTVVMASLDLLDRRLPADGQEAKLVEQGRDGARRIKDIVLRMTRITRVEAEPATGPLPQILDIRKSSDAG